MGGSSNDLPNRRSQTESFSPQDVDAHDETTTADTAVKGPDSPGRSHDHVENDCRDDSPSFSRAATPPYSGSSHDEQTQRFLPPSPKGGNGKSDRLTGPYAPIRNRSRGYSLEEEDEASAAASRETENRQEEGEEAEDDEKKPVAWRSLPHKSQLAILTFARLSEPLAQTSLQAYMFYQLKSFDPSLPDATVSKQTGILQGAFTAAQFATAVLWGRLADTERFGRKKVLLIGLLGTSFASFGFGFSKSFLAAAIFRTLGGALNSNIGVMRTMIAEIIEKKRYQSRAFLLLPMCFNVGVIIGPIVGGVLADPMKNYPSVFGPGSVLGGKDGVSWMREWPFALPNIFSGVFIFASAVAVFLGLEETHEFARYRSDTGLRIGQAITRFFRCSKSAYQYRPLDGSQDFDTINSHSIDLETNGRPPSASAGHRLQRRKRPSFKQTYTPNVIFTLISHFLLALHTSAFTSLCFVFLPNPRAPDSRTDFFHFGGGLGMSSSRVGFATAIIGIIGLPLQIFIYPRVQFKMGTLKSYRTFLPFSPLAYVLAPFLVLVPDRPYLVWPALAVIMALQVMSRTFSLPAIIILVNNSVTESTVLGTVHGVAQSISSAARTLGPLLGSLGLGLGLENNIVGAVWWALAAEALVGWLLTWTIYEGKGIEKKPDANDEAPSQRTEEEDRAR